MTTPSLRGRQGTPPPGDGLLPPEAYRRQDESTDASFYEWPRKVVHIDDGAIAAAGLLYADMLPQDGRLLDLMSAWRTHLPMGFKAKEVVGLGMNADEMADNPQLTGYKVHDLNRDPKLPFEDETFDGAMCAVSIQYMVHPVLVFREVRRVLRPAAPFVLVFSNRCFPTKAVAIWHQTDDRQHSDLVRRYFEASEGWMDITAEDRSPNEESDPLYAVWAHKAPASAASAPPPS